MRRIKLVVSYDGTAYCGWQLQPNGVTIEEVLNKALSSLLKEDIQVIGASRTDSGVHAMGNVAVFDTESRIPGDKICFALNQRLPDDVRIQASEEVPLTFHPRKANCVKTYEYKILNRKIDMPLQRLYSHFCYFNLDLEKMQKAASYLIGEEFLYGADAGGGDGADDLQPDRDEGGRPDYDPHQRQRFPLQYGPDHRRDAG